MRSKIEPEFISQAINAIKVDLLYDTMFLSLSDSGKPVKHIFLPEV